MKIINYFKTLLRQFTSPNFLRLIKFSDYGENTWEGIYRNWKDVPVFGQGYNDARIISETCAMTRSVIEAIKMNKDIPVPGDHISLCVTVAASLLQANETLRILDFGGGAGIGYAYISSCLGKQKSKAIDYHVVEQNKLCDAASLLFTNDQQIHFHYTIPQILEDLHLIYICSTLQYVEDYKDVLNNLVSLAPRQILFAKFSGGMTPTYVTSQRNLDGSAIPYRIFNLNEFIEEMEWLGYILVFKGALERNYCQNNFPPEYRWGKACNLLFTRR